MDVLNGRFGRKLQVVFLVLAFYIVSVRFFSVVASPVFTLHADVEWDLESAKKQLQDRVHGQATAVQQLVDNLEWTRLQQDDQRSSLDSSLKIIFLLGGPGVGKTEA